MQTQVADWFRNFQSATCDSLEKIDSGKKFISDEWKRPGGGGGLTRVITDGEVFERGGVNFSLVHGKAPEFLLKQFSESKLTEEDFLATGVSIVMHPANPFVPIIHMNIRYFEMGKYSWFGGGIDLTPHFIIEDDAVYFHKALKEMCDRHHASYYYEFRKNADDYFFLKHRNETRGIGGIFYDHLKPTNEISMNDRFEFVKSTGEIFIPLYSELVKRNAEKKFGDSEIAWQRLRRGRYVEFNLIYDKGTKFGLETDGRTESILMSLPPMAAWSYNHVPAKGSREEQTQSLLKKGIDWASK